MQRWGEGGDEGGATKKNLFMYTYIFGYLYTYMDMVIDKTCIYLCVVIFRYSLHF